ncbi:MAG: hypothetical protein M0C28_24215 [Candidatus Moduliflexus flocculans]|nr:hypothetical protein [Candidatus Moduliflexus flocculans]
MRDKIKICFIYLMNAIQAGKIYTGDHPKFKEYLNRLYGGRPGDPGGPQGARPGHHRRRGGLGGRDLLQPARQARPAHRLPGEERRRADHLPAGPALRRSCASSSSS